MKLMHTTIRWTLALFFTCASAMAQEARYVWTGVTTSKGVTFTKALPLDTVARGDSARGQTRRDPLEFANGYRKELAAIQLSIEVDRKLADARTQLDDLWFRAAWSYDYAERIDVLAEIAEARATLLAKLGDHEGALHAASALFLDEGAKQRAGIYQLASLPADLYSLEASRLADPRLRALRTELSGTSAPAQDAAGDDEIARAVGQAYSNGNGAFVMEIGPRAVPALEKLIGNLDAFPTDVEQDPLYALLQLGELRGARFILDHFDQGGFFWKKRVVRAMKRADVLDDEGTWQSTSDGNRAPRLLEPVWLEVLALVLEDPSIGREVVDLVALVARRDALDPSLQKALAHALRSDDPDLVRELLHALERTEARITVKPVLESLLDHPADTVRRFAAARLTFYSPSRALRAAYKSPDPEVRVQVAGSFRLHSLSCSPFQGDSSFRWNIEIRPEFAPEDRPILASLLADSDARVRAVAAAAIMDQPAFAMDEAVYLRIAKDSEAAVRRVAAEVQPADPTVTGRMLEILAHDSDPQVLAAVDERLASIAGDQMREPESSFDPFLSALITRFDNVTKPMTRLDVAARNTLLMVAFRSTAGVRGLVSHALEASDDERARRILGQIPWAPPSKEGDSLALIALDDDLLRRTILRVTSLNGGSRFDSFMRTLATNRPAHPQALIAVTMDASAPRGLRLGTAWALAQSASPDIASLSKLLADPSWRTAAPSDEERDFLLRIGERTSTSESVELLERLVRDRSVPDLVALPLLRGHSQNFQVSPALALESLARWESTFGRDRAKVLSAAIGVLGPELDPKTKAILLRYANDREVASEAVAALARSRDPELLPMFGQLLARSDVRGSALEALTGYFSDEAAELLLKGASASDDAAFRESCFAALSTIRRYQEEKGRWAGRKSDQERRDEAVSQLLAMLDDPDAAIRAQAARGLGTLDAVEQLPRLVKLLKDSSPDVRQAAQDALEVLNRPKSKQ